MLRPSCASAPPNSETWIETPFLQMVLTRLWDEEKKHGSRRLRLATLNKLGGAPKILRTHLDKTMRKLKRRHRRMAVDIFGYLVTPSGGKIAHTVDDLASYSRRRKSRLAPLLERLADSKIRVLRTIPPPPGEARRCTLRNLPRRARGGDPDLAAAASSSGGVSGGRFAGRSASVQQCFSF